MVQARITTLGGPMTRAMPHGWQTTPPTWHCEHRPPVSFYSIPQSHHRMQVNSPEAKTSMGLMEPPQGAPREMKPSMKRSFQDWGWRSKK